MAWSRSGVSRSVGCFTVVGTAPEQCRERGVRDVPGTSRTPPSGCRPQPGRSASPSGAVPRGRPAIHRNRSRPAECRRFSAWPAPKGSRQARPPVTPDRPWRPAPARYREPVDGSSGARATGSRCWCQACWSASPPSSPSSPAGGADPPRPRLTSYGARADPGTLSPTRVAETEGRAGRASPAPAFPRAADASVRTTSTPKVSGAGSLGAEDARALVDEERDLAGFTTPTTSTSCSARSPLGAAVRQRCTTHERPRGVVRRTGRRRW